ncbi:hypothetical protein Poli38472_002073 [Pythium oligandrum]|uniref:Lupus La protein n=1 Tax=Pythium oligandrum TaxID=41045 RepID=A0A8K1CJ43_PYTOL|nr:hypothetical protein Poli38472_002073 [Pythium oligandrum]|eukprot:TMW63132.1 hypothetical protein Poli38472_002073 [Pythium oligandrum]
MAEQIQKQVEFYFSDSNFRRDKFLQEATTKYEGGFIPFSVLFTFKKLAAMTTDPAVLHAAIATSDVVEVNENKDALRRKHALPEADDSKARTIVFAGLGTELPSIDDIKEALAAIDVEPLYVYRKNFNKKFAGVAHVEFKDVETLKKVQNEIEKVSILKRTPSALPLAEFHALTPEDQVEFEKSVRAMLVAKDVPVKHISTFFNALQPVWDEEPILRSRVKLVPESKELYLLHTQPSFAERVLEHVNGKHPVVIDGTTLSFELVTDKAAIAARPRTVKTDKKKDNKRKRENDGKAIHISNIAPRVRMDDIKKLLAQVMDPATRSPFIEYDGMDTAKFIINDAEAAKALFDKLVALGEKAELGGQQVQFHLLEPSEELQVEIQYEKGLIVQFSEVDGEVSRDDIKNTINEKLGDKAGAGDGVAFIKYQINDKSGFLRVTSAALAQDVLALFQAGFEVNGVKLNTAKLVEGDEEKQFWVDARTARSSRFKQSQKNKNQMKRGRKY